MYGFGFSNSNAKFGFTKQIECQIFSWGPQNDLCWELKISGQIFSWNLLSMAYGESSKYAEWICSPQSLSGAVLVSPINMELICVIKPNYIYLTMVNLIMRRKKFIINVFYYLLKYSLHLFISPSSSQPRAPILPLSIITTPKSRKSQIGKPRKSKLAEILVRVQ